MSSRWVVESLALVVSTGSETGVQESEGHPEEKWQKERKEEGAEH